MKKDKLSLEGMPIVEIDNSLSIENPIGYDMLDEEGVSVTMEILDKQNQECQGRIAEGQDVVASLESMAHYLQKKGGIDLGKAGAVFANIAVEQFGAKRSISLEELPINIAKFESDPEEAIGSGVVQIGNLKETVLQDMSGDMTKLLYTLTQKRELFNKAIQNIYRRISEVEEAIEKLGQRDKTLGIRMMLQVPEAWHEFFYEGEFRSNGSTVVPDITFLMTEHNHLFKRLIKRQLEWIEQHKDNILKSKTGFDEYSFNPIEFNINGTKCVSEDGEKELRFVSTNVLPGERLFNCLTSSGTKTGFDAAQSLLTSRAFLTKVITRGYKPDQNIGILTVEKIEARIAELKHGLEKLKHWCDVAYRDMWKEAFFDETMISFLLRSEAGSLNERGLSIVAQAVLSLLENSTTDIGQYALLTFSSLLEYLECCMSMHNA